MEDVFGGAGFADAGWAGDEEVLAGAAVDHGFETGGEGGDFAVAMDELSWDELLLEG